MHFLLLLLLEFLEDLNHMPSKREREIFIRLENCQSHR